MNTPSPMPLSGKILHKKADNMDAKNNTGSAVLAVEPCSFIHRSNRLVSALQFFPYTGRRKALTCLPEAEKHIEVIVVCFTGNRGKKCWMRNTSSSGIS